MFTKMILQYKKFVNEVIYLVSLGKIRDYNVNLMMLIYSKYQYESI